MRLALVLAISLVSPGLLIAIGEFNLAAYAVGIFTHFLMLLVWRSGTGVAR